MTSTPLSSYYDPALCANTSLKVGSQKAPCQSVPKQWCSKCKLVRYCSKDCQRADWAHHKKRCNSDLMEPIYTPSWYSKTPRLKSFGDEHYYWGNVPAFDVLNPKSNEGFRDMQCEYNLLFAASGDLRNVIKTIVGFPSSGYEGQRMVVLNDRSPYIVVRNILLLIVASALSPKDAVPTMIRIWYSAFVPASVAEMLQHSVLPLIEEVCEKIIDQDSSALYSTVLNFHETSTELRVSFLIVPEALTVEVARRIRDTAMKAPQYVDYVDRKLYELHPAMWVGMMQFRDDGILLPFGSSREEFDTLNPTLFQAGKESSSTTTLFQDESRVFMWPIKNESDPGEGWAREDYVHQSNNDVYGALFFYLREQFAQFCKRLKSGRFSFQAVKVDAQHLAPFLTELNGSEVKFDRIEIWLGPEATISAMAPLLQPKASNPHATLILLFIDLISRQLCDQIAFGEEDLEFDKRDKQFSIVRQHAVEKFSKEVTHVHLNPELVHKHIQRLKFCDFDGFFDKYVKERDLRKVAERNGLNMKDTHTLVEPWPYRITEESTKEEFERRCATELTGSERYLEFGRSL
ncbi:hypothetical protein CC80DRAFT_517730 [Byssothecium circinans]|uniref:MYND-type domain-containing protein n=1 Tax=Byssothecium circinans TaxID=147558 RepID=A0A6A5TYZ7_9PLEO|nr:hypothetical protein CC80DRAFT_517730 [Byssothecium circinans]